MMATLVFNELMYMKTEFSIQFFLQEALKDPQRRILKSSKVDPLNLMRASRLSSHSYILCNDVFVHFQVC